MISVFQIYFDEKSEQGLENAFYPYRNEVDSDYFENHVMEQIYYMNPKLKEGIKYLGVSSWKQNQKTNIKAHEIVDSIQKNIDAGIEKDVYIYCSIDGIDPKYDFTDSPEGVLSDTIRQPDMWHCAWHIKPQVKQANELLNNSGVLPFDIYDGKWVYCRQNYWIARKEIFDEYCKTVLIPAMNFFNRPEMQALLPKWYEHPHTKKKYNSCCFTLEGLFGSFLAHKNYSYKWICKKKYTRNRLKDIRIDGYEITNNIIQHAYTI